MPLLAAALACVAYLNALDNPFVYDDRDTVLGNRSLADLSNIRFILVYTPFRPAGQRVVRARSLDVGLPSVRLSPDERRASRRDGRAALYLLDRAECLATSCRRLTPRCPRLREPHCLVSSNPDRSGRGQCLGDPRC